MLGDVFGEAVSTCCHIVLPAVPRAGHDATVEFPVSHRSARVSTDSVDRVKCAVDIEQRDDSTTCRDFESRTRRHVLSSGKLNSFAHRILSGALTACYEGFSLEDSGELESPGVGGVGFGLKIMTIAAPPAASRRPRKNGTSGSLSTLWK